MYDLHFSVLAQKDSLPVNILIVSTDSRDQYLLKQTDPKEIKLSDNNIALKESEEQYRLLFQKMDQGFCIVEIILDENRQPVDYLFRESNPVFEEQTGLKNVTNRTARELVPDLEDRWFRLYGDVALTGESNRFIEGSDAMQRWFDVYTFKIGDENSLKVAIFFNDITHSHTVYEGSGLGLSLCKKIVERHNGILFAKGVENKGAEFSIILPVSQHYEEIM